MKIQYFNFTSGLLLSAILILFSCNEDINLSAEIQGNTQFIETQYTDTFTIQTSVGIWDTVETTMSPYMLVGHSQDEYFGKMTTNAFGGLILPADDIAFRDSEEIVGTLDSVMFSIDIDESFGDTLQPQVIQVHVLTDKLDTNEVYYQDDEIAYGDKIAEFVIDENTDLTEPLRVRLSGEWETRFFEAGGTADLANQENFEKWLPGLRISAIGGGAIHKINHLSTNTSVLVYYHTENDTLFTRIGMQNFERSAYRFNQIITDLSSSQYLASLTPDNDIPTENSGNFGFLREGSGIYTKVKFPHLDQLNLEGNIHVNRAELVIEVADENFTNLNTSPPVALTFNLLDENGDLIQNAEAVQDQYVTRELRDNGVHGSSYIDGRLVASYILGGRVYQNVMITSYIQDILAGVRPNNGFAIRVHRDDGGVNSLILPDNQAEGKNLRLKLYFTEIK